MIGKNIYELRKKRGFTLSELAERSNISKSYLSNIERNLNQNPSIQVIERIAMVLDVDLKVLLRSDSNWDSRNLLEKEWIEFVHDLKESGIDKDQIKDYKTLIDFIKWQNENTYEEK